MSTATNIKRCVDQETKLAAHKHPFSELEVEYRGVKWEEIPPDARESVLLVLRHHLADNFHRASVASGRRLLQTEACERFWSHVFEAAIAKLKE